MSINTFQRVVICFTSDTESQSCNNKCQGMKAAYGLMHCVMCSIKAQRRTRRETPEEAAAEAVSLLIHVRVPGKEHGDIVRST